jgi:hypothetical protein
LFFRTFLDREIKLHAATQVEYINYLKFCKEYFLNVGNKYSSNVGDTNDGWNTFLQKTMNIRPEKFTSPIFVKITDKMWSKFKIYLKWNLDIYW